MKDRVNQTRKRLWPSIQSFKGGVRIIGLRGHGRGNENPPLRGEIKGWSTSSRRRMRDYLLTHEPKPGRLLLGVTLTIPGDRCTEDGKPLPPPSPDECRHLFNHFAKHYLTRNGCGMVWRLELQTRGNAHWHGIVSAPAGLKVVYSSGFSTIIAAKSAIREYWFQSLRVLGKHHFLQNWKDREVILFDQYHGDIFGADRKAVNIQDDGGRGVWMRYLQDHATKSKQEQIAVGFGRHWGVVGRSQFLEMEPENELAFSCRSSYFRFWRAFHRLTRPVMSYGKRREKSGGKFAGRPFAGRSLGWSSNRGVYGQSVWFSKPETVRRIMEWAESARDSG